jgi:hypothetical protein
MAALQRPENRALIRQKKPHGITVDNDRPQRVAHDLTVRAVASVMNFCNISLLHEVLLYAVTVALSHGLI